jgi:hypothetical protein
LGPDSEDCAPRREGAKDAKQTIAKDDSATAVALRNRRGFLEGAKMTGKVEGPESRVESQAQSRCYAQRERGLAADLMAED